MSKEKEFKKALKINYDTKWKDLKRRGFTPPRDAEENARRLREARDSG